MLKTIIRTFVQSWLGLGTLGCNRVVAALLRWLLTCIVDAIQRFFCLDKILLPYFVPWTEYGSIIFTIFCPVGQNMAKGDRILQQYFVWGDKI